MERNSFIDFIVRNRYVILFVSIVLVLLFTGIISMIMDVLFTAFLIILAIYLGKRIQEDSDYIKRKFSKQKRDVEYTVADEEPVKDEEPKTKAKKKESK